MYVRMSSIGIVSLITIMLCSCQDKATGPDTDDPLLDLSGPYLGQQPPGNTPVVFAPDIFMQDSDWAITFSPDGRECFFTRSLERPTIMTLKEEGGFWTSPVVATFSGTYLDIEPHITPDGDMLYFGSHRPLPGGGSSGLHQWKMEKTDSGWTDPEPMDPPLRNLPMMYPSVANNGNMYFTDSDGTDQWISVSIYTGQTYQAAERLGENINSLTLSAHPFIAPDESYLIFDAVTRIQNNQYISDLFISFRNPDGTWGESVNMGAVINSDAHECCAFISRNPEYLFFYSDPHIYWVDAGIIESLRPTRQ